LAKVESQKERAKRLTKVFEFLAEKYGANLQESSF
jgi:hypothetical protein